MLRYLLIFCFLFYAAHLYAQIPDHIILKKKNGRTIKSYYPGSTISFKTNMGTYYEGTIANIKNDSLYLKLYQVNVLLTKWNTRIYDTVKTYLVPFFYKDISIAFENIDATKTVFKSRSLLWWISKRLWIGAGGFLALNLINSANSKDGFRNKGNLSSMGIALGIFTGSFILDKVTNPKKISSKRFQFQYIKM